MVQKIDSNIILRSNVNKQNILQEIRAGGRLQSLDFYRGLVMVFLMLESSGILRFLENFSNGTKWQPVIMFLFDHAHWHALHFWDLIQPAFMFIAGTALAFSIVKQNSKMIPLKLQWSHALKRSGWLFFWGVLDYAVSDGHLVFELWDVLTQLSFTLLLTFAIFRWKVSYQILFSLALLLLTQILYTETKVVGFDQPFVDQHNFGNYLDIVLMNKTNSGGWVAINCLPTAAHTIWGAVIGKTLLMKGEYRNWMKQSIIAALLLLAIGYLFDYVGIAPIIKRISTISFTLVAGGWCILAFVLFFWWIDLNKRNKNIKMFLIVGMNSIFIYLFMEIAVRYWLYDYTQILVGGVFGLMHLPNSICTLLACIALFVLEWEVCRWLYRKKIFFKL